MQQIVDVTILARVAEGASYAAGKGQPVAGHVPRNRHGRQQPLAQGGQLQFRLAQGGQYDGELVAGQARHHVPRAHLGTQHLGEALQQGIADVVSQPVVDPLEAVEIEEQQAQGFGILAHPLQLPGEAQGEGASVGQAGEGVVSRLVFQLALQRLELGDVAAEDVDPGLVAPARDHGDPEVASAYGEIETVLETHLLTGEGLCHIGHGPAVGLLADDVPHAHFPHLFGIEPEVAAIGLVGEQVTPLGRHHADGDRQAIGDGPQSGTATLDLREHLAAGRDVVQKQGDAHLAVELVTLGNHLDRDVPACAGDDVALQPPWRTLRVA